jgi:hypothetical protein
MNDVFGIDGQDYGEIRRLCLICHGLDRIRDKLFEESSCKCEQEETKMVFHELMSDNLKKLATAFQMDICHRNVTRKEYPTLSGGSIYYINSQYVCKNFNITEISEKIINADSVSNDLIPAEDFSDRKMTVLFTGVHHGEAWALYLSVDFFVETLLNFLDHLEINRSYPKTPRVNLFSGKGLFEEERDSHDAPL